MNNQKYQLMTTTLTITNNNIQLLSVNPWTNMITIQNDNPMYVMLSETNQNNQNSQKVKKILCSIQFTEQLDEYEIVKLFVINENKEEFEIKQRSYEKRENEIMIKHGPLWEKTSKLSIKIILKKNDNLIELISDCKDVENIF